MDVLLRNRKSTSMERFALLAVLLALAGCGGATGQLETAKVKGIVVMDGKPLTSSATVLFEPATSGKMATGIVQTDGTFELTTYATGDGAIVGTHRVAVAPLVPFVADKAPDSGPPPTPTIPSKYHSPSSSGLSWEVKAGQLNECRLELSSK